MSCKDCIHFVACVDFWYSDYDCFDNIEQSKQKHANDEGCVHFKPTADVVEVRHGYWLDENLRPHTSKFICSECGDLAYFVQPPRDKTWKKCCPYKYCPNCGAQMKGE